MAAEILSKKGRDFTIKIGGFEIDGSSYNLDHIKNVAKKCDILDKCNFVGIVRDKENFFADVDILCVASREETFGLVIVEGFLFSTLVISSDSDGGKFLIKDSENGLLFPRGDFVALAENFEKSLDNPKQYASLTKSAYLDLQERFSFDHLARELDKILKII